MRVVVQKYGGSSVSDLDKLRGVADRVANTASDGTGVVVVVSAMGNTTNELIALAKQLSPDPDRRELDMLISVGERISMALLAMALRDRGVDAVSMTGSQSGIITDDSHADAQVVEVRPARVRQCLEQGKVVIVAGFQGVSRGREVTTLGRGGSDTTAVVLAAALQAEHCEICSDVDGVFSADPRIVASAKKIERLGLDEALGLARGGAGVLFEDAVLYARDHGVTLQASATFGPGSGTRLTPAPPERSTAVAVTGEVLVAVQATGVEPSLSQGCRVRRVVDGEIWLDTCNAHGEISGRPIGTVTAVGSRFGEQAQAIAMLAGLVGALRFGAAGDVAWWQVHPDEVAAAQRTVHDTLFSE